MRKTQFVAILVILLSLFLPFSGQTSHAAAKVLHVQGIEFSSFDPQRTGRNDQGAIESALFRGLLRYDENGNPAPSIAQDVPTLANGGISADGKTITYKLRDWKWSDGKGVITADDFVYTFQRLVDPTTGAPYGNFLNDLVVNATDIQAGKQPATTLGVKAVDPKTFQVSLLKPVPFFNNIASMWIGYVVRKDNVERSGLPKAKAWTDPANGEVVGSGPFRITSWDHGKKIVYERNPNYSGTAAKLDEIDFSIINDPTEAFAAYKNDELDIVGVPPNGYDSIKADPQLSKELTSYTVTCTNYLGMNNATKPFDNPKVRAAFTYAMDRDTREKVVDHDLNVKQLTWLPKGIPGYEPDLGKQYDFDPAKAKQALADAGYEDGKGFPDVTFNYPSAGDGQTTADWYKAQFKKVLNIDIKLNPMDTTAYLDTFNDPTKRLPGLYEYGWCADYAYPSDWMQLVWGTNQSNNVIGYSNPAFDTLSQKADTELDQQKAITEYQQAEAMLLADFPVIMLNSPQPTRLVKPRVQNLKPSPLDAGVIGSFFWEDIDLTQ